MTPIERFHCYGIVIFAASLRNSETMADLCLKEDALNFCVIFDSCFRFFRNKNTSWLEENSAPKYYVVRNNLFDM